MSTDLKQEWYFGCCTQVQVPLNYKIWVNVYKCSHHRKLMGIGPQTKQAGYWSWAQYAYRLRICSLKKEKFKLYIHYSITKLRGSTSIEKWINLLFWFAQALNQCIIMHYASLCRHKGRSWQILHHEEISWILWRLFRDRLDAMWALWGSAHQSSQTRLSAEAENHRSVVLLSFPKLWRHGENVC